DSVRDLIGPDAESDVVPPEIGERLRWGDLIATEDDNPRSVPDESPSAPNGGGRGLVHDTHVRPSIRRPVVTPKSVTTVVPPEDEEPERRRRTACVEVGVDGGRAQSSRRDELRPGVRARIVAPEVVVSVRSARRDAAEDEQTRPVPSVRRRSPH